MKPLKKHKLSWWVSSRPNFLGGSAYRKKYELEPTYKWYKTSINNRLAGIYGGFVLDENGGWIIKGT